MKKIVKLLFAFFIIAFMPAASVVALDKVEFGGEIRFRYEQIDNDDFDKTSADYRTAVNQLTRFNARLLIDERTTAFLSIQDSRKWGEEKSVVNTADERESTDLDEAWLLVKKALGPLNLKIGRQRLVYGNQKLVSEAPWSHYGKRFDGVKVFYAGEILDVDLFFTKTSVSADINSKSNVDDHFNGLYTSLKKILPATVWDLYVLQKKIRDASAFLYGQNMLTVGTLLKGRIASLDWSAEYAEQSGTYRKTSSGDVEQDARFSAINAGYTFDVKPKIRIGGEWITGTGDKLGTDDRNEGFDNLYTRAHYHYGMSDVTVQGIPESQRLNNIRAFNFNLTVNPFKKVKFKTSYWNYEKEVNDDRYGQELNFQLWYELTQSTKLYAYYATYTPKGDTGEDMFKRTVVQVHTKF